MLGRKPSLKAGQLQAPLGLRGIPAHEGHGP